MYAKVPFPRPSPPTPQRKQEKQRKAESEEEENRERRSEKRTERREDKEEEHGESSFGFLSTAEAPCHRGKRVKAEKRTERRQTEREKEREECRRVEECGRRPVIGATSRANGKRRCKSRASLFFHEEKKKEKQRRGKEERRDGEEEEDEEECLVLQEKKKTEGTSGLHGVTYPEKSKREIYGTTAKGDEKEKALWKEEEEETEVCTRRLFVKKTC